MTRKGGLQSREQRQALLTQCGQIAANASKSVSTNDTAEAPGDFLLHLDHPKISFGEIVVKRNTKVFQEGPESLLVFVQAVEQIASRTLLASSPSARWCRCPWVRQLSFIKQEKKLSLPISDFQWVQPACSLFSCLFSRFPRDAQRDEEGKKDGLPCGLKKLCSR